MPRRRTLFQRRDVAPRTFIGIDDNRASITRRDLSEGMNNRQHPSVINEKEAKFFQNIDLTIPGERRRRPGCTQVEDIGSNPLTGSYGFEPQGFQANLMITEGTNLKRWPGSGTFSNVKTDFTTNLTTTMIKAFKTGVGDVLLVSNGTDNVFEMHPGTYAMTDLLNNNDSPPKTIVYATHRNRVWALKNDLAYFSDAAPSNYATAFDRTTNNYRMPVGEERAIISTRDYGLIFAGKDQVWGLNPSTTPAATDKPEKISEYGCVAGKTFIQVGDDYMYLAFDGVRELYRTNLDKLKYGSSFPTSYRLKEQFDSINWTYAHKSVAVFWDNKYFIALPTNGSSVNNQVWVYYPATKGWMVIKGWYVTDWAKFRISNEERLYFASSSQEYNAIVYDDTPVVTYDDEGNIIYVNGTSCKLYRAWYGPSDDGVAIEMIEESRNEDMGYPLVKKFGAEFKIKAKPAGDYDILIYGSFDNSDYYEIGSLNVSTSLVTFPTEFPVSFNPEAQSFKKIPLDQYGEWYEFRHKIYHNTPTTNSDDISIYETSMTAIPLEYDPEETT